MAIMAAHVVEACRLPVVQLVERCAHLAIARGIDDEVDRLSRSIIEHNRASIDASGALHVRMDDIAHERLPRRWVNLIRYLDEEERKRAERSEAEADARDRREH